MTAWAVYDNKADDIVGVWNTYEDADSFLFENAGNDDLWAIFPWLECLQTSEV